jgi:DNA-directed RNA polymerase subunit RPC12/RpoP
MKKFAVSEQDFINQLVVQDYQCAICGLAIDLTACVDHDHQTLELRGLLCQRCNRVLGVFQDTPKLFEAAAAYLRYPAWR